MNSILVYGEIGVDNAIRVPELPAPELAVFPTGDTYHIGGAATNVAVALAAWGLPVTLAGNAIGDDDLGRLLRGWLAQYPALDLSLLDTADHPTPFCRILVLPSGERAILVFGYPQTRKTPLTPALLEGVRFLALDLYGGPERLAAAQQARAAGAQTLVGDIVWLDHPVLPLTSIATNSAAYIRHVFPGRDPVAHAQALREISGGVVITTDGGHPVHVLDQAGQSFRIQPPRVPVVDATGAGDAFKAGLLYGLQHDWELPRAVAWGVAAGALKVGRLGAGSKPAPVSEVEALARSLTVNTSVE
jgi:sugar/nucleoside kinase (ribokinase family)